MCRPGRKISGQTASARSFFAQRGGKEPLISHKHWLAHEMPQWIREEIITEDGAEKLRRKYTVKTVRREDILMRIALIMAVCFMAAGICFIIADNWHSFSQGRQFFFAWLLLFISVLTAGWFVRSRMTGNQTLRECIGTFCGMAFTASVFLVHGSYMLSPDLYALAAWTAFLLLPVVYVLRSAGLAIIYVCTAVFATASAPFRGWPVVFTWAFLLLILPYFFGLLRDRREKSLFFFSWVWIIGIFYVFWASFASLPWFLLLFSAIAPLVWLLGVTSGEGRIIDLPFRFAGGAATFAALLYGADDAKWNGMSNSWGLWVIMFCFLAADVLLSRAAWRRRQYLTVCAAATPFVMSLAAVFHLLGSTSGLAGILISFFDCLLSAAVLFQGVNRDDRRQMTAGFGLLLAICAARGIGDASASLLSKGLVFLSFGILILLIYIGFLFLRNCSRRSTGTASARRENRHEE